MSFPTELRALYECAVADPTSLNRAEMNLVRGLPPPEEEDKLCVDKSGLTKQELIAKALVGDDLTRVEIDILRRGIDFDSKVSKLSANLATRSWPIEEQDLYFDARSKLVYGDELEARNIARLREQALLREQRQELELLRKLRREGLQAPRAEWVQKLVDANLPRWGFVCFRTTFGDQASEDAWTQFQDCLMRVARRELGHWKGGYDLLPTLDVVFISDETLDTCTQGLRTKFCAMREAGEIQEGVRNDCFLIADEAAIAQGSTWTTGAYEDVFVTAVDPDHAPTTPIPAEGHYAGYAGEIKASLDKVFSWLHYSLWAQSETWRSRYWQTRTHVWNRPDAFAPYSIYPTYGHEKR